MPRIAKKDYDTSFFHIMVQGIRKENIFENNTDKEKYINILYKKLEKHNIKIIAYCVMDNHVHILTYFEDINEVSEYMRAVNTTYAIYYNKKYRKAGYVFRNRYRAEPIYNEIYLVNCIHYIHDNPIKAKMCNVLDEYKYSSYYEYKFENGEVIKECKARFKEINSLFINRIYEEMEIDYTYMDYEEDKEYMDSNEVLKNFIDAKKIKIDEIKLSEAYLEEISKKLYYECGVSQKEIAKELKTNKTKISRLINRK